MLPLSHSSGVAQSSSSNPGVHAQKDASRTGVATLAGAPDCVLRHIAGWLNESDSLRLMQTGRRNHDFIHGFYAARLKPQARGSGHPAQRYRDPEQRLDRYIPADRNGLQYLAGLGIYYPLTEQISKNGLTTGQAQELINERRGLIRAALTDGAVSARQKNFLCNSLIQEHILCGRCSAESAIGMARDGMNLFYSLTLNALFRSGQLDLADLESISAPGLRLLHDPLLAGLFRDGTISRRQLLALTDTQFIALTLCRRWLAARSWALQEVLALSEAHIALIRKARLMDDVHAGRMTLSCALARSLTAPPLFKPFRAADLAAFRITRFVLDESTLPPVIRIPAERVPHVSMRQLIAEESDVDVAVGQIQEFGKFIQDLAPAEIIRQMDTSTSQELSVFAGLDDGLRVSGGSALAMAYNQIYINLADKLGGEDYLRVLRPYLSDVFRWMVAESVNSDDVGIIDQCSMIWSLAMSACAVTGLPAGALRELVMPLLDEDSWNMLGYQSRESLTALGRLLHRMGLLQDPAEFFNVSGSDRLAEEFNESDDVGWFDFHGVQAFLSPFAEIGQAKALLEAVALKIDQGGSGR